MKVIDLQYITHCTNDEYQLIMIHGADDTLIYIKPSKTLTKWLLKQKGKTNSIKTGVNQIQQASLLPNGIHHWTLNLIKNEIWKRNYKRTMTDDYNKRDDMVNKKDIQNG